MADQLIALRLLSRDVGVSPEVYSVSSRLLLSLFLHLSRLPPSLVSKDLTFHSELSSKLQNACIELASARSAALGRTLPLLMNLCDQSVRIRQGHPFVEDLTVYFLGQRKLWYFGYSVTPEAASVGPASTANGERFAVPS